MVLRISIFLFIFAAAAPAADEDPSRLAAELPRLKPLEPEDARLAFRPAPGFTVELVAAEPLVASPVAMAIDEDGRMWVVEMRDYPFTSDPDNLTSSPEAAAQPSGRVSILEDLDGDGRADRSRVFADRLHWPTGIALWKGGAFVTAAPDILYLRDEDGDGAADTRRAVWSGFERKNVQALLNNLRWGLDGWLYGAGGGNEGLVGPGGGRTAPAPVEVQVRGRDFRFRPDGSAFELLAGGGQFGLTFDDWGERFVCSNSNHLREIVLESRYLERNPHAGAASTGADIAEDGAAARVFRASTPEPWRVVRTRWRASAPDAARKYAPTELFPAGFFTSASGLLVYRGDAFPAELRGNVFVGDVGGNLVHRKVLSPNGIAFTARRAAGEEAGEFLVSTDNWFRPVNLVEAPDGTVLILDMYRETIEHPYSIPDSIKAHLRLTNGNDRGRIWRVAPLGFKPPPRPALSGASTAELLRALERPGGWWRETAQRLLIERGDPAAAAPLRSLAAAAPSPMARLHAVSTLEAMGVLRADDLHALLADPHPRLRQHALRLAEPRLALAAAPLLDRVLGLERDSDPRVRFQLALSLGRSAGPRAAAALGRLGREGAGDPWMRSAVLSSSAGRAGEICLEAVSVPDSNRPGLAELARSLARTAGAEVRGESLGRLMEAAARPGTAEPLRAAIVEGLADGARRAGARLRDLLGGGASALDAVLERAAGRAGDARLPLDERRSAARLLAHAPLALAEEPLCRAIDVREPRELQLEAVRSLSSHDEARVAKLLIDAHVRASPETRREVLEALFAREDRLGALLAAVERGELPARALEPARVGRLLDHPNESLRAKARELFSRPAPSERRDVVARYRAALDRPGDADRGKERFRQACASCHVLEGNGHAVGPDLRTAKDRAPESLLEEILDPNRQVLPGYTTYLVLTADGQAATGLIAAETAAAITLRRAGGVEEVLERSRLREMRDTGLSLMPEGLEKDLKPDDIADLIAYLRSVR